MSAHRDSSGYTKLPRFLSFNEAPFVISSHLPFVSSNKKKVREEEEEGEKKREKVRAGIKKRKSWE